MYYPQHMSAGQPPAPQTVTSGGMHYPQHQQPTLLQPGPAQYSAAPYNQYGYANGLTSPPTGPPSVSSHSMGNPQSVLPLPGVGSQVGSQAGTPGPIPNHYQGFDTTGQQPPPGMKPRVTATLWEDEGSLCFQVEARGICVARREDNHMINGTKLLNVAGMTRGRRDGILKSEKVRHVVKIGPMHLKGVWIPYDRALDFANKEKITELLYPLFVHNIGALLYHPTNQSRAQQVMAAAGPDRKKEPWIPGIPVRNSAPPPLPSIGHPSMPMSSPQAPVPVPSQHSNNMQRPGIDRAHTFPTPPGTTGASMIANVGSSDSFNWQGQHMNGPQVTNPLNMDNGLNSSRSMPTTPATTPPGNTLQSMQNYQSSNQAYDNSRPMYSTQPQHQSPYQNSNGAPHDRMYAPSYHKNDMGPPASRPSASGPSGEHPDSKGTNGMMPSDQSAQQNGEEENEQEHHEAEYTHDSGAYDSSRNNYNYSAPSVGNMANDANLSPEMTGSPSHPPAAGRATPRTTAPAQSYYPQHAGYHTPPRVQQTTSNLYNVMSGDRTTTNGAPAGDVYASGADLSGMPNGYASQAPMLNGSGAGLKRSRDDEDELPRPIGNGGPMGNLDLKRRKTMMETNVPAPAYDALNRPASAVGAPRRQ